MELELARLTAGGQTTIPRETRANLDMRKGDRATFATDGKRVLVSDKTMIALRSLQELFRGEAKRQGLETHEDVVKMMKELRRERRNAHAGDA
jgi:bifunctional DNA-binding transcriptional regulator/antitoxin component of YhaV-PrlF toxin-antitoxin module